MISHGVVKHWELVVTDETGEHITTHRNWDDGIAAFKQALSQNPKTASLYACSGKYAAHRIKTYDYEASHAR